MNNRKFASLLCVTTLSFGFSAYGAGSPTDEYILGAGASNITGNAGHAIHVTNQIGNDAATTGVGEDLIYIHDFDSTGSGASVVIDSFGALGVGQASSITTTGANAAPIYVQNNGSSFSFSLNNTEGATIESQSTGYFYGAAYIINGTSGTNSVANGGVIRNNNVGAVGAIRSALYFSAGNTSITNSGTIEIADSGDVERPNYAIRLDNAASNLNLTILAGSNITGKIRSLGSANVLSVEGTIDADALNALIEQIDTTAGTWTKKIGTNGALAVADGKTIAAITNDDGTINNLGAITSATMINSGSITNSGTISNLTMSAGTTTNNATRTITNLTMTGGTLDNAGIVGGSGASNTTVLITGGAVTNSGTFNALTLNGTNITSSGTIANMLLNSGGITNSGTISNLTFVANGNHGSIDNSGTITINTNTENINYNKVISGNGTIIKTGAYVFELSGTSTHSGTITANAGGLKINGTTASTVIAASGSNISGTGTIGGALTVESGATLAAGNSIGTLNVGGAVNLNAGSTTAIEFNNIAMDKTIATGNITVDGTAAFSLYNYSGNNYFVVSQNILETTGGAVSGTFANTTIDDDSFVVSTDYSSTAVRATISKKINSSTLDAQLTLQNAVGRMVSKAVTDELNDYNYSKNTKAVMWISSSAINSNYGQLQNSTPYSVNGVLTSAGVAKKYNGFDLIGGIFNSRANANRFDYFGQDDTTTNGGVVGVGQGEKLGAGSLYNSMQIGVGFYNSSNTRNVAVNGAGQIARSETKGQFQYLNFGTSYNLPVTQTGQLSFSILAGVQQTSNAGFEERDLSYGNLTIGKSSASTINTELGVGYQDQFAKFLHLPNDSFYKFELTGYQSNLYHKHDARVNQGNASYMISSRYKQGMVFGANGYAVLPVNDKTSIVAKFSRRQNGTLRDSVGGVEVRYSF